MNISKATGGIAPGLTAYFLGIGGTEPYVYSVFSGVGSIDSSSGLYTAPSTTGVAVIRATDDDGAHADASIIVGTPLELFCEILRNRMGLADDQCYMWDQKIKIPSDSRLYIAVSEDSCKSYSNNTRIDASGNEVNYTNMQSTLGVDIFSRSGSARDRKEEVVLALNSIYSQQQQERNSFYIAKVPANFVNISESEGSAILYRFNIAVNIQYVVAKSAAGSYYDTFEEPDIVADP